MTAAADPTNTMRASDILADRSALPVAAVDGPDPNTVRDNEGGNTTTRSPHQHSAA